VDPASYTLNIVDPEGIDELVLRLRTRLDGDPRVEIEQRPAALRFVCKTWRPMLMGRVDAAIDAELGVGERERMFRPFG
jgi:hypothetical protein